MGAADQHLPDVTASMHVFVCLVSCKQTFVTWCVSAIFYVVAEHQCGILQERGH